MATLAQASSAFATLGIGVLAGFFRQAFGLSLGAAGLVVTSLGFAPLLALLPAGRLIDRHGERIVVAGGALLLGAAMAGATLASSYETLLLLLLLAGVGYSTSQPGGSKAVAGWFRPERRGLAMGIRQTGLPLGGVAAATVLPPVAAAWSWRAGVGLAALVAAAGGVAFGAVYREPPAAPLPSEASPRMASHVWGLLQDRATRGALWAGMTLAGSQFCLVTYLMLFLRDARGIPLVLGAWVVVAAQGAGVVGRVVLGALSDREGRSRRMTPVVVSLAVSAVGVATLPLVPSGTDLGAFAVLAGMIGFFGFGWYGPWVAQMAETASPGAVGLTLGVAMTANQVGIVVAPPLFGLLVDATGSYGPAWWVLGGVLTAVTPVVALSRRRED